MAPFGAPDAAIGRPVFERHVRPGGRSPAAQQTGRLVKIENSSRTVASQPQLASDDGRLVNSSCGATVQRGCVGLGWPTVTEPGWIK